MSLSQTESFLNATFSDRQFGWRTSSPHLSHEDAKSIRDAVLDLNLASKRLLEEPSFDNIHSACLKSRTAATTLYLSWHDFLSTEECNESIELFKKSLDIAIDTGRLVKCSESEKVLLDDYVHSLARRRVLLELFRKGDF